MAVEYAEKALALGQLDINGDCVFHGAAPPLHAGRGVGEPEVTTGVCRARLRLLLFYWF